MNYSVIQKEKKNLVADRERNWFVAYTAPRAEKKVAQRLENAGVEYTGMTVYRLNTIARHPQPHGGFSLWPVLPCDNQKP